MRRLFLREELCAYCWNSRFQHTIHTMHCQVTISNACQMGPKFCTSCTWFQPQNLEAQMVLWVIFIWNHTNTYSDVVGVAGQIRSYFTPTALSLNFSALSCAWNQPPPCLGSFSPAYLNQSLGPQMSFLRHAFLCTVAVGTYRNYKPMYTFFSLVNKTCKSLHVLKHLI